MEESGVHLGVDGSTSIRSVVTGIRWLIMNSVNFLFAYDEMWHFAAHS